MTGIWLWGRFFPFLCREFLMPFVCRWSMGPGWPHVDWWKPFPPSAARWRPQAMEPFPEILLEGTLRKESRYLSRWRTRWFVLTRTCLCSYKRKGLARIGWGMVRWERVVTSRHVFDDSILVVIQVYTIHQGGVLTVGVDVHIAIPTYHRHGSLWERSFSPVAITSHIGGATKKRPHHGIFPPTKQKTNKSTL